MALRIWKYTLDNNVNTIEMPTDAKIVHVGEQRGACCLWVLVDDVTPLVERTFNVYSTGEEIPDNIGDYLGTFMVANGNLVYHVFEGERIPAAKPIDEGKKPANPFSLYYSSDEHVVRAAEATKAIKKLIDEFIAELDTKCEAYRDVGSRDTASREAIQSYITERLP